MQLREMIAEMSVLEVHGSTAVEVSGISYDARRVQPGDIYVALQREHCDGQAEVELAISRGAVAVVCRKAGAIRHRVTKIEVADTRQAMSEFAAVFYGRPGERLHVIGVTGGSSAWKTAHLTKQLLEAAGVKTGLISSLRHEIGERTLPSAHFTEPCDIQRLFAGMVRSGCTACVLELPAISPAYLKGIPVNVLLYQGQEQNLRALSLFLRSRESAPVCGIVNIDEEGGRAVANSNFFPLHLSYGFNNAAEVSASEIECGTGNSRFLLNLAGNSVACEVPVIGQRNIRHLLGAATAALSMLTPRQVIGALSAIKTAPASLERVSNERGLSIYIDEASTPEALAEALSELRGIQHQRILLAFGSAENGSGKERFDLGRAAAQFADHVILTSDNPGHENQELIFNALAQGIESAGRTRYHLQPDRAQAIRDLIAMAEPGDLVLIAGKGERTHQIIGSTAVPFSDRAVAVESLRHPIKPKSTRELTPALCAA
jgi:UDP-N-acetylmuramoyl-L-alanyl-D-glutamate--2,6-diaminopimelate ligase